MKPGEVCTAQISSGGTGAGSGGGGGSSVFDTLALGGSTGTFLIIGIAVCTILIGGLVLLGAQQLRRKRQLRDQLQGSPALARGVATHGATHSLFSLVCVGAILASLMQPSPAAAAQVQYSDDCRLIEVTEVTPHAAAQSLLPGDEVTIMTALVTNISSEPLNVSVATAYAPGSVLENDTQLSVVLNGTSTTSLRLLPGEDVTSEVGLKFSEQAGNSAQQISALISLTVTAVQS